ncbi:RNA-directed DNA polymerase, eukaryota, reverse transcriptase zinc-binding domain protein [Tanacetum coccineum]
MGAKYCCLMGLREEMGGASLNGDTRVDGYRPPRAWDRIAIDRLRELVYFSYVDEQSWVVICRIGDVVLSDHNDAWNWSPNITKGFSVASARSLIDSYFLDVSPIASRWNGCIPIKVNIFLWKLLLNKLPTRVNLDWRGIDVPSILCPICQEDVETANHIFLTCEMASTLWSMLDNWWEVEIHLYANMEDWISWLDTSHLSKKVRVFLDDVGGVLLWHIWSFRKALVFSISPLKKALLWDNIVSQSFMWISFRNPNLMFSWVGVRYGAMGHLRWLWVVIVLLFELFDIGGVVRALRRGRTEDIYGPSWQYPTNTGKVPPLLALSSHGIDLFFSVWHTRRGVGA